jgi:hypothetical protein
MIVLMFNNFRSLFILDNFRSKFSNEMRIASRRPLKKDFYKMTKKTDQGKKLFNEINIRSRK